VTGADELVLRPLALSDERDARRAHAELAAEGFMFLPDGGQVGSFADYLDRLDRQRRGVELAPGRVRATLLVAEVAGDLVGRTSIRHELNAALRKEGGHVGYAVRPGFRGRGYATRMLQLSIAHLRDQLGVHEVLVTCDDDNPASARVIERCGGQLEGIDPPRPGAKPVRRYWIAAAPRQP
jgi:predicted acetyltransferase